jgi:hypothetical protein
MIRRSTCLTTRQESVPITIFVYNFTERRKDNVLWYNGKDKNQNYFFLGNYISRAKPKKKN